MSTCSACGTGLFYGNEKCEACEQALGRRTPDGYWEWVANLPATHLGVGPRDDFIDDTARCTGLGLDCEQLIALASVSATNMHMQLLHEYEIRCGDLGDPSRLCTRCVTALATLPASGSDHR